MKHNHTNHRFPRSGQSSYSRHRKREYQYSVTYQNFARNPCDETRASHDRVVGIKRRFVDADGVPRVL